MLSKYVEKEQWLNSPPEWVDFKCLKTSASAFYRDLFPVGSFQNEVGTGGTLPDDNKGNGFIVYKENQQSKTRLVFDDLKIIEKYSGFDTAFISPVAYFGKNRTLANARLLFALVFDLDEVGSKQLDSFFGFWIAHNRIPFPTYIINSGGGVHLYYVFKNPIPLYPNIQKQLKKLKYALTEKIWNGDTSALELKQYQGINQGFRIVGSKTKHGEIVTCYKIGGRITLEELSKYVSEENRITDTFYHPKITLEQAKKKYPEWYHQRIELGRQKKNWICKRDLYDWWKSKYEQAEEHHRYFYIMCLTVYAVKCGIDFEELKKDAYSFVEYLSHKAINNPFTKEDVKSALEMYQECYRSFPRDEIEKVSGIEIPKNKRNGRKQDKHLQGARAIRDINNNNWRENNGRKSAKDAVFKFLEYNQNATYKEFEDLTDMKKSVFYKYRKLFFEQSN